MKKLLLIPIAGIIAVACSSGGDSANAGSPAGDTAAAGGTGFASVSGIFSSNCTGCHGAVRGKGGLNLTDYAGVIKGGEDGPVVTAGDPDNSVIIKVLHGPVDNPKLPKMPPGKELAPADIQKISDWIKAGAKES